MPQRFMFEGHWYTIDQIKSIKARREEEAKKAEEEAEKEKEQDNKPVSKMNKDELEEALTGFEVDYSNAKNNDDLRKLLNDYLDSIPEKNEDDNNAPETSEDSTPKTTDKK